MNKKKLKISLLSAVLAGATLMSPAVFAEKQADQIAEEKYEDAAEKEYAKLNKAADELKAEIDKQEKRLKDLGITSPLTFKHLRKSRTKELAKAFADEVIKNINGEEMLRREAKKEYDADKKREDEYAKKAEEKTQELAKEQSEKKDGKIDWSKIDGEKAADFKMNKKVVDEVAKDLKDMKKTEEKKTPENKNDDNKVEESKKEDNKTEETTKDNKLPKTAVAGTSLISGLATVISGAGLAIFKKRR